MASTNHFQRADSAEFTEDAQPGARRRRGLGAKEPLDRKRSRNSLRKARGRERGEEESTDFPALEGLMPVLSFLAAPAFLVLAITLTGGGWPKPILYGIALILGLVLAMSALKGVELVLACLLIYLPFSKVFVVPLAPGINGTNMLILLGLFSAVLRAMSERQKLTDWPPGSWLVMGFGAISAVSAFTIILLPGGRTYFLYSELLSYKAWIDQFIVYFILLTCIRDTETAKRCVIYVMMGSMLVVLYSVPEMLDKMGRSTIDKSRIDGPHMQSNNFGGFVAYTVVPIIAFFLVYMKDLRAWLLTPYFLLTAKVLITTFSRGAYVAFAVGALMAGWFKGKAFLAMWLAVALVFLAAFPSIIPDSIMARMDSLISEESSSAPTEEKLDKSSSTRLIMWRAAGVMILEDPILGKGFKAFPYLKDEYTETPVEESDPHSMYLYIGSQMGLPALALFLMILAYCFFLGRHHARNKTDKFIRAVGIGGASATVCYAVVCVFGSRAVSLNFTIYFWALMVVMQVLRSVEIKGKTDTERKRVRARASSHAKRRKASELAEEEALMADAAEEVVVPSHRSGHRPSGRRAARKAATGDRKRPLRGAAAYQMRERAEEAENDTSDSDESVIRTGWEESHPEPWSEHTSDVKSDSGRAGKSVRSVKSLFGDNVNQRKN